MFKFDTKAWEDQLKAKAQKVEESARAVAQAGAQVFYEQVLSNVPVKTGKLKKAIYQAYGDKRSGEGRALYDISWNKRKAPHGHLIEFGTSRAAAHPFLRPAHGQASARVKEAMLEKLKEVLRD